MSSTDLDTSFDLSMMDFDEPPDEPGIMGPPPKFKLVRFKDVKFDPDEEVYLVDGIIPLGGLVVVWGPPKCGKSFKVFDMFMHVALGWRYRDRDVVQGDVVYLALEGAKGFTNRIEAFRQRNDITTSDPPFFLITNRTNLIADHRALIEAIRAETPNPKTVVLDTLNRSLVGSESKDEDMAKYLAAADAIREAFPGCAVVIIHHCGVDGTRPRGHTSLGGAVDAQIAVSRDKAKGYIEAEVEWMKDGVEGAIIRSKLEPLTIGLTKKGTVVTSCVVVPLDETKEVEAAKAKTAAKTKTRKMPKSDEKALRALRKAIDEMGKVPPASNHIPQNTKTVTVEQWQTYAIKMGISPTDTDDAKRVAFKRSYERLTGGEVPVAVIWNGMVWPAAKEKQT